MASLRYAHFALVAREETPSVTKPDLQPIRADFVSTNDVYMQHQNTLTGCLNKGADADHFVLKDDHGQEYIVTGYSATLARHANNHNVVITGTMGKENGKDVLKLGSATNL